ncbi:MAG: hypothetical protein HYS27_18230 [Deltaproteobacteria bacterium]|nr:hypothetical protein [Deltaproteobacteria bacterium]
MARLADQLHVEQVRAVEARAQEAVARAEVERGALLRQVTAGLAHEINNPLAAVIANLGFLEQASGPAAGDGAAPFGLRARGRDSGLGLMLAREACRTWGGVVEVARADRGGEQITVRLPRLVDTSGR